MRRIMVVANQTLGGEALQKRIRELMNTEPCEFFVVVPETLPRNLANDWAVGDPLVGAELRAKANEQAYQEAHDRAQARLDRLVHDLRELGAEARGELGDPDPLTAINQALPRGFDEIVLSTLPAAISRWLKMDLPSRVERHVDLPVTTVIPD